MSRRIAFITREDVKAKWGTLSQSKKALATDTSVAWRTACYLIFLHGCSVYAGIALTLDKHPNQWMEARHARSTACLLYTSDAADE